MPRPRDASIMGGMVVARPTERAPADEFQWLFTTSYPGVVRTVYYVVHDRQVAEEIAQEAFVALLSHWKKVRTYDRPDAWVRRVAVRRAQREAQRDSRRLGLERRAAPVPPPADEMTVPDPAVLAAVRTLGPKQRAIVALFYFEDRPMDEIADIVGCSVSTGWVQLHNARRRLAELLAEEVTDDVR